MVKSDETRSIEDGSIPDEQQQVYDPELTTTISSKTTEKGSGFIEQQNPHVPPQTISGDSGYKTGSLGSDHQFPDSAVMSVAGDPVINFPKSETMIDIFASGLRHSFGPRFDPTTSTLNIEEVLPDLLRDFAIKVLRNTHVSLEREAAVFVRQRRL